MPTLCLLLQVCFPPFLFRADLQQGSCPKVVAASCWYQAEESVGNALSHHYSVLPRISISWAVSHCLAGLISLLAEGCALSLAAPQAQRMATTPLRLPAAALTSSPALSTRQPLGVLPKYGEWHPRQNCFSRLSSQSHFISGNWDLFGEVLFFPQDYSNFVLNVSLSSCLCS